MSGDSSQPSTEAAVLILSTETSALRIQAKPMRLLRTYLIINNTPVEDTLEAAQRDYYKHKEFGGPNAPRKPGAATGRSLSTYLGGQNCNYSGGYGGGSSPRLLMPGCYFEMDSSDRDVVSAIMSPPPQDEILSIVSWKEAGIFGAG